MYKTITTLAAVVAFATTATAHGTVNGVTIDGQYIGGFKLDYYYAKKNNGPIPENIGWYAENLDNGFIEPNAYGTADIICHKAASPEGSSDSLAKVAAGGTVEFHWSVWPESHMGPVITYVAPYTGDVASVDKTALKWTKIQEDGYANGAFAAVTMVKQNNTWPVTVPASLAPGKYVFRHEIIALHGAGSANGAQNYPQCLDIEVTGSGTKTPEGVVGTKLYTVDEDGIIFNPYGSNIVYNIPGPALWDGASSGSAPTTPTTPTTPSNGTASAKPSAVTSAVASAKPSAVASAVASATPVKEAIPSASPAAPAASAAPSSGAGDLPKEFTIETFITWLEGKASSSASKTRRHARALF